MYGRIVARRCYEVYDRIDTRRCTGRIVAKSCYEVYEALHWPYCCEELLLGLWPYCCEELL